MNFVWDWSETAGPFLHKNMRSHMTLCENTGPFYYNSIPIPRFALVVLPFYLLVNRAKDTLRKEQQVCSTKLREFFAWRITRTNACFEEIKVNNLQWIRQTKGTCKVGPLPWFGVFHFCCPSKTNQCELRNSTAKCSYDMTAEALVRCPIFSLLCSSL